MLCKLFKDIATIIVWNVTFVSDLRTLHTVTENASFKNVLQNQLLAFLVDEVFENENVMS